MPTIKIDTLMEAVMLELSYRGHADRTMEDWRDDLVLYLADKVEEFYDEQR